jgi:hypothetical protein
VTVHSVRELAGGNGRGCDRLSLQSGPRDKSRDSAAWIGLTRRTSVQGIYIRLAAESARVQPARSPLASSRLARAIVAENFACRRAWARLTEPGVGWRSNCAPTDCGAVNPAFGFPADRRMAASNSAMSPLQGPACATVEQKQRTAQMMGAVARRSFVIGFHALGSST